MDGITLLALMFSLVLNIWNVFKKDFHSIKFDDLFHNLFILA